MSRRPPRRATPATPVWGGVAVLLPLLCGLAGCCWSDRAGPVPTTLLECRQLSSRGVSAMQRHDFAQAETLLAEAVNTYGLDPEAHRQYAAVLWQRGARGKALAELDRA